VSPYPKGQIDWFGRFCRADTETRIAVGTLYYMTMGNTVEEFDDVGKVHAVVDDDLAVILD